MSNEPALRLTTLSAHAIIPDCCALMGDSETEGNHAPDLRNHVCPI